MSGAAAEPASSAATRDRIPLAKLHVAGKAEQTGPFGAGWLFASPGGCAGLSLDGVFTAPSQRFVRVEPGTHRVSIRFRRIRRRPLRVIVWAYSRVDRRGSPAGEEKWLKPDLVKRRLASGGRRWVARLRLEVDPERHLLVQGAWKDRDCRGSARETAA